MEKIDLGGSFTFPATKMTINRIGYGAMQIAGAGVYGLPRDPEAAIAVLREAVERGVNHIDTSDFYGPHITNQIIKQALHPYSQGLVIVTKVGARRESDKSWHPALLPAELASAVEDNLRNLGLERLDIVNLRLWGDGHAPAEGAIEEPLAALVELKEKGLIGALGISNATARQIAEAQKITQIVCVQNQYNLTHRANDAVIDELAALGVAFVPFFPLGGFSPLQSATLSEVAESLQATPLQTALAWLLQRSPNILLIPGTSSVAHLRENLQAAALALPPEAVEKLNSIGGSEN